MYGFTLPDPPPYTYKCIYAGGREMIIVSDFGESQFLKVEKKSPNLAEVWKLKKNYEQEESWDKIYPANRNPYPI